MAKIMRGSVVMKFMPGEDGKNFKDHPVVIICRQEIIDSRDEIWGVVASHEATKHPDTRCRLVHLPHVPDKNSKHPFWVPTAAVCDWLATIKQSEIKDADVRGFIQLKHLEPVINKVGKFIAAKKAAKEAASKKS